MRQSASRSRRSHGRALDERSPRRAPGARHRHRGPDRAVDRRRAFSVARRVEVLRLEVTRHRQRSIRTRAADGTRDQRRGAQSRAWLLSRKRDPAHHALGGGDNGGLVVFGRRAVSRARGSGLSLPHALGVQQLRRPGCPQVRNRRSPGWVEDQVDDEGRPAGLVCRTEAGAVVAGKYSLNTGCPTRRGPPGGGARRRRAGGPRSRPAAR
jgi:hypothetical protein